MQRRRYERVYKRAAEANEIVCGEESQRNEREMTLNAKHKKVVASDMQLATTWLPN